MSRKMALQLQDIDPEVDFPVLACCMLEAYNDPPQSFTYIFFTSMYGSGRLPIAFIFYLG